MCPPCACCCRVRLGWGGDVAPDMMKSVQVDKGAIKFVLSGANIMCRGLTSPGGRLPEGLQAGEPVVGVVVVAHGRRSLPRERRTRWRSVRWPCPLRRCMCVELAIIVVARRTTVSESISDTT